MENTVKGRKIERERKSECQKNGGYLGMAEGRLEVAREESS